MPKRKIGNDVPIVTTEYAEKCVWTTAMEDVLIDVYVHQHNMGNRQGGMFTSKALNEILKEMRECFPNRQIDKTKIKDHMKRIKNKFTPCYDLFKHGLSGFGWDPTTNMWITEPKVWKKLIEAKPEAAIWRNKPMPYYEKMLTLYGQDRATGEYAETAAEVRQRRETIDTPNLETIDDIDFLVSSNEATLHNFNVNNAEVVENSPGEQSQAPTRGATKGEASSRKRKGKSKNDNVGMDLFAKSIEKLVESFAKSTAEIVKNGQPTCLMSDNEVWALLEGLEIDTNTLLKAYYFLIRDVDAQRAIIRCPPDKRKQMLTYLMSLNNQ